MLFTFWSTTLSARHFTKIFAAAPKPSRPLGPLRMWTAKKCLLPPKSAWLAMRPSQMPPNNSPEQVFTCTSASPKSSRKCQNGIIDVGGKKILHSIEHNDVSQAYHSEVCQGPKATVVHGKVTEVNGIKKIVAIKSKWLQRRRPKPKRKRQLLQKRLPPQPSP